MAEKKMPTINVLDAQILEDWEQQELTNRRTRRAIHDTYGPKSPTKKRRKLGGKRRWKNKGEQYKSLEGQMTVKSFNNKQAANDAMKRIVKRQQKLMLPDE